VVNTKAWFVNLSRVAQLSIVGSVLLGGLFFAAAVTSPPVDEMVTEEATEVKPEVKKEPVISYKTETEFEAMPYSKSAIDDSTIAYGETRIGVAGVDGKKMITHAITLTDGIETHRKTKSEVIRSPVEEVTLHGTYVAPAPQPSYQYTYYRNCTEARSMGAAPVYVGEPGYGVHLDRDRDGIGCE